MATSVADFTKHILLFYEYLITIRNCEYIIHTSLVCSSIYTGVISLICHKSWHNLYDVYVYGVAHAGQPLSFNFPNYEYFNAVTILLVFLTSC